MTGPITQKEIRQTANKLYPILCAWEAGKISFARRRGLPAVFYPVRWMCHALGISYSGRNRQLMARVKWFLGYKGLVKFWHASKDWKIRAEKKLADFFRILGLESLGKNIHKKRENVFRREDRLTPLTAGWVVDVLKRGGLTTHSLADLMPA